ncbi:ABC transporter transmembrane domain-containing protein [Bradyrhizobium sp. ARR65]|uniref:ABC transporter transmembrane domain-containing protein n=1 Tax=Bradyrhizobium sp. ARR65 TaxID=1040989 RepID=UPI0018DB0D29|nr:ABC transporter transmembrane domain-containing protein [Bradyrhizobium sp. ARR65]
MARFDLEKPPEVSTLAVAASITSHLLALAIPLALLQTYDRILPNQSYSTTFVLAVGVTVAIVLEALLRYARSVLLAHVGSAFESRLTVRVLDHVLRADSKAFHQLSIPDLSYAVRGVGEVREFWSGNEAVALHELPFALIYIVLIAYIGSRLALIPLGFTLLALIAALIAARSTARALRDVEGAQLERRKLGWGIFLGIVEAKAMAAETLLTRRYRDAVAPVMQAIARVEKRMGVLTENGSLLAQLSTIGILTVGAFMVVAGELTTGGLAACTLLAGRSVGPVMSALRYLSRRGQRLEAEGRINKVLSLPLAPVWAGDGAGEMRPFTGGTIVLSGQALHRHGGSVSIPQGTFVHLDVPNSPVAAMTFGTVARLEDSLGLSITFDGRPSSAYDPASFRRGVTMASSRGEPIRGTLLDNLTLFSRPYEAAAMELSERLGLSAFVDGLHQGFMTPIGPGDANIVSPGIAARIGLIRALVRQPFVLCLDNADGSLDLNGVKRLGDVLKELKGRTTVLIVSSSPALLQLADMRIRVDRRKDDVTVASSAPTITADVPAAAPKSLPAPPEPTNPPAWSEKVWLERLEAAVGAERRSASPIAAALPAMLVALGWVGTARSVAALLPPPGVPVTLAHLELLLPAIGYRTRRLAAAGSRSDTARLRAGSLTQTRAGDVGVYLGQPDGKDRWLVNGSNRGLVLSAGDTILAVEPDINFQPVDQGRPNWFRRLFEQMRNQIFELFAISSVINILALAVALYTMAVYSLVIPSGAPATVWGLALVAVVATIGGWGLRIGRQFASSRLGAWAGTEIGTATIRKMLALPIEITTRFGVQNNVVRMRSFENARAFLSGAGGLHLMDYPFVAIFLVVIGLMGGWLIFVPVIALFVFAALAWPTSDYVGSKSTAAGIASGRLEEHAVSAFLSVDSFYRAGADSQWLGHFSDLARDAALRNRDYWIAVARAQAIGQALGMLTVLATLCTGIVLVLGGMMEAGGLVAAIMLIWRITTPAQQAFDSVVRLRQVRSAVQQVDQLMATPAEPTGSELTSPVGLANVGLRAERIYYRPDANCEAALNGVTFSAAAGQRIAIAGPSAGGKTMLLECLAGLRRQQSGRVLLGGRDIRQFDTTEYRAWMGYVPQVVPALPLTVRDYLRLRAPTLRDDEAFAAFARLIGPDWRELSAFGRSADEVLDRKFNSFSQDIAELQFRHIIAFVAATLNRPAVLLLDGDGVAGSPEWEPRILRYLDSIHGSTTVVWAPHLAAHIQSCDQIIVLDRGNVLRVAQTAQLAAAQ